MPTLSYMNSAGRAGLPWIPRLCAGLMLLYGSPPAIAQEANSRAELILQARREKRNMHRITA